MNFEKIEALSGFRDLLILDSSGEIKYQQSSKKSGIAPALLSGYLASAFTIAENTSLVFTGNSMELSFDGEGGSVLIMHSGEHYFFLVLDSTPSMGIARLKLRELVDEYEL
jgi:predicted regulator of Ras-like GTPase activity (Roadblock/LC7/MglB family)